MFVLKEIKLYNKLFNYSNKSSVGIAYFHYLFRRTIFKYFAARHLSRYFGHQFDWFSSLLKSRKWSLFLSTASDEIMAPHERTLTPDNK